MSENEFTPTAEQVSAAFEYAGLAVPAVRIAANHETYSSTLGLIRKASVPGLGETVPAAAFKAHWD